MKVDSDLALSGLPAELDGAILLYGFIRLMGFE
jgi:hypothetical protein